jgi:hypothetical protein
MDCFERRLFDDLFGSSSVDVAEDDFGAFRVEELEAKTEESVILVLAHLFFHCLQRLSHASGNMSFDDQSGINQSPTLHPPSSSVPDKEKHMERIINNRGLRTFFVMGHTANLRKNSKISAIQYHVGERRCFDDNSMTRYLRCAHCTGGADGNGG